MLKGVGVSGTEGRDPRMTVVQRLHAYGDPWGSYVFASHPAAVATFNRAVEQLVSLSGDPVALAEEALSADPGFPLARVLHAYLALYSTSALGFDRAQDILAGLDPWNLEAGERELLAHAGCPIGGPRVNGIVRPASSSVPCFTILTISLHSRLPRTCISSSGNSMNSARLLTVCNGPGRRRIRVQGSSGECNAFGLEENGYLGEAREQARRALEENPRDIWAVHAQAHIFDTGGFPRPGIEFLEGFCSILVNELLRDPSLVAHGPLAPGLARIRRCPRDL